MTYVIAQPCVDVKDKACIEECPVDCIYEGERTLYIHPDECVDCGACEPVCPVEAIFYEDDTPAQWKDYYRANVDFFTETTSIGSPGGASKIGPVDVDHPVVMAFPEGVRRIIYTTNAIEALNSKLRRAVRTRGHFPGDDAAMKLLYLVLNNAAQEWKRPPREWSEAKTQFAVIFGERFVI